MSRPNSTLLLAGMTVLAALGVAGPANAQGARSMRDCANQCSGAAFYQSCLQYCESQQAEAGRKKRRIILVAAPKEPPFVATILSPNGGENGGGGGSGRGK